MDSFEVKEVRYNCYLRQMESLSVQRLCVPSPFHPALLLCLSLCMAVYYYKSYTDVPSLWCAPLHVSAALPINTGRLFPYIGLHMCSGICPTQMHARSTGTSLFAFVWNPVDCGSLLPQLFNNHHNYDPKSVNKATSCHLFLVELGLNSQVTQPTKQVMKEKKNMTVF